MYLLCNPRPALRTHQQQRGWTTHRGSGWGTWSHRCHRLQGHGEPHPITPSSTPSSASTPTRGNEHVNPREPPHSRAALHAGTRPARSRPWVPSRRRRRGHASPVARTQALLHGCWGSLWFCSLELTLLCRTKVSRAGYPPPQVKPINGLALGTWDQDEFALSWCQLSPPAP